MSTAYEPNFNRSAVAPVISAGVMTANIIWKATKAMPGMSPSRLVTSARKRKSKLPIHPLPLSPKTSENPTTAQMVDTKPMANMFCINMPSTFFERTMPP
jgi:hypothetical protein